MDIAYRQRLDSLETQIAHLGFRFVRVLMVLDLSDKAFYVSVDRETSKKMLRVKKGRKWVNLIDVEQ